MSVEAECCNLVYVAAPLFSLGEREFNLRLCEVLEGFVKVFLPQRDGLRMIELVRDHSSSVSANLVHREDTQAIQKCDALLAVLDGAVVDCGVSWEMGYAYCLGKPVVALHTDERCFGTFGLNPMIEASITAKVKDIPAIEAALKSIWEGSRL